MSDRSDRSRRRRPLAVFADERAIEGLPIRLVIALVVGVASLSVMMSMLSGIGGLQTAELDAEPEPEVVDADSFHGTVVITVVDDEGTPVAGATVLLQPGTAGLEDGTQHATSGDDGEVVLRGVQPELGRNQQQGTLTIDLQPPAGSEYQDRAANAEILVLEDA